MGKWASGSSRTTADTAAREDRRGHGQLSPDPLQPGDQKHLPLRTPSADGSPRGRVHFPTDLNLLFDAGRKCLDLVEKYQKAFGYDLPGWRKLEDWRQAEE